LAKVLTAKSTTTRTPKKKTAGAKATIWIKIKKAVVYFFIFFFTSTIGFTILYRFIPPLCTPLMLIRVVQQVFNGEEVKMKYKWKNLEDISAKMPLAVIASEDSHFKTHYGFDVDAIYHAYKSNQKKGKKIVKGGSTISQQTAKNVFLWPGRSWIRKGLEVYFTVLIETLWGKKRIIEMYLNVIEMGNGIYGTEAAARKYFDKPAKKLTKYECAAITSVLPSPRKWSVTKPSAFVRKKQQRIVTGMNFMKNVKF